MLVGIFLRNFKTYENFNFIPFSSGKNEKFNLFVGNNGAGKSSVLEALSSFFNDRPFIVHSNSKVENSSVAPVFLVHKDKYPQTNTKYFMTKVSDILWENNIPTNLKANNNSIQNFSKFIDSLKAEVNFDDYIICIVGISPLLTKDFNLISFESNIQEKLVAEFPKDSFRRNFNAGCTLIKSLYNFVYIPIETSIVDFLKLEDQGMQSLMDQDLKIAIEEMLLEEFNVEGKGTLRNRNRKVKMMSLVNEKLEAYLHDVENTIQRIDGSYHFNKDIRSKRVNPKDFINIIIDIYFKTKRLQKNKREIAHLSAGERKKALIDIAYSFISQNKPTEKEIIIAIDEPESSLNISMCYEQFERIEKIANIFNKQVFITTHWYGSLPILNNGRLYHVQKKTKEGSDDLQIDVEIFALENYFEERGSFPNDMNLKSFYDLTSSLVSAIRNSKTNWLIVEGNTDKKYIQHYIDSNIDLKVLPVGGGTIVKKIFEYLYLPISINEETNLFKGSILCLIDTDPVSIKLDHFNEDPKNQKLKIRRLQIENIKGSEKVSLLRLGVGTDTECEIEHVLNPIKYYNAIEFVLAKKNGSSFNKIKEIAQNYCFNEESRFSRINNVNSIFKPKTIGRNQMADFNDLCDFANKYKNEICNQYIVLESDMKPEWINELENYFT